ncbi:unnamed protein product [Adineta steineri]|uniref:START domain-containing protein n=1 Tax=Adineta steineri TaxID=433720 RepID=A0A814V1A1_9BILA|nr:unnamed protein product [Adineta steineri]CAF1421542.1 unnamed protein product [Adineta steineri]CAF1501228.1 unnamed protein product [Adineta steineri]CAF1644540.1 unnamed protein product [Adineta steineri]
MADEYDATTLDGYIDDDLALIKNTNVWEEYKHGAHHNDDICYVYKTPDDPIWWIKLVAYIDDGSLANIDDLLDASLQQRHSEWHALYLDGRIVRKNDDGRSEICYFQYASPSILTSGRDMCYIKVRRNLDNGFILSYRSVDIPEAIDSSGKFVRATYKGAHLIETSKDAPGFLYTYLQYADPGGSIPKVLVNRPQCDIILNEIDGIRRALKNSIHSK